MLPTARKLNLAVHVTFSAAWLGAVVAYLSLAIVALTSHDAQLVRAALLGTELIGWFVIVPCALATLLVGIVQSLGTEWGLLRHYWVAAKFVLTTVATAILLGHMRTVSRVARIAQESPSGDLGVLPLQLLVHAVAGLAVLLTATALSVFKPWGRTPYGRRKQAAPPPMA
jgi:hypothetical protein